jgi:hypothetical protein
VKAGTASQRCETSLLRFEHGDAALMADDVYTAEQEQVAVGRAGREWQALDAATDRALIAKHLGLEYPIHPESDNMAAWLALIDFGICFANIVREPRLKVKPEKAARDAMLGRDTTHLAPQWRYPISDPSLGVSAEAGIPALILPVGSGEQYGEVLSLSAMGDEDFAATVADLVAIPLDGSRPLSMTGYTVAVGSMRADYKGRLVVYGSGRAWLDAYLFVARTIAADTPSHLVERLHVPFPEPDFTLLVEPKALEWRVTQWRCVIPTAANRIVCPDSRSLAQLIDTEMRKKVRVRTLPTVCGPKKERAA